MRLCGLHSVFVLPVNKDTIAPANSNYLVISDFYFKYKGCFRSYTSVHMPFFEWFVDKQPENLIIGRCLLVYTTCILYYITCGRPSQIIHPLADNWFVANISTSFQISVHFSCYRTLRLLPNSISFLSSPSTLDTSPPISD